MRSLDFLLEALKRSLLLPGTGREEDSPTARFLPSPLITPKDPRTIHELLNLVRTYAHPQEWARVTTELRRRLAKRADITNSEMRVAWHHPWHLPDNTRTEECVSLGEYLNSWRK